MGDTSASPLCSTPGSVVAPTPEAAQHSETSPCSPPRHSETPPCCTLQDVGGHLNQNGSTRVPSSESLVVLDQKKADVVAGALTKSEPTSIGTCGQSSTCDESKSVQDADCSSNDDSSFEILNNALNANGEDFLPTSRASAARFSWSPSAPASSPMLAVDDCFHLLEDCFDSDYSRTSNTEHLSSEMLVDCAKVSGASLEMNCHESNHYGGDSPADDNDSSYPPVRMEGKETSACSSICNGKSIDGVSSSNRDSPAGTPSEWKTSEVFAFEFPDSCRDTKQTVCDLRTARLMQRVESETVSCYHDCRSRPVSESDHTNGDLVHPANGTPRTNGKMVKLSRENIEGNACTVPCSAGDVELIISASQGADCDVGKCLWVDQCPNGEEEIVQHILTLNSNGRVHRNSILEHINGDSDLSKYKVESVNNVRQNDTSLRIKDASPRIKDASPRFKDSSPRTVDASPRATDALSNENDVSPHGPVSRGTHPKSGIRRVRIVEDSLEVALRENSSHKLPIPSGSVVEREPDSGGTHECKGDRVRRRKQHYGVPHGAGESREGVGLGQTRGVNCTGNISVSDVAGCGDSIPAGVGSKRGGSSLVMAADSTVLAAEVVPDRKKKKGKKRSDGQMFSDINQSSLETVISRHDLKCHAYGTKSNNSHQDGANSSKISLNVGAASCPPRTIMSKGCGQLDVSHSPLLPAPSLDAPTPSKRKPKSKPPARTWRRSLRDSKGQPPSPPANASGGATTTTTGTSGPMKKLLKFLQNVDTKRGQSKRIKRWKSAENLYQQSYEEEDAHRHANDSALHGKAGGQQRSGDSNNRSLNDNGSVTADDSLQRQEGGSPAGSGGDNHSPLVDGVFSLGEIKDLSYADQGQEGGAGSAHKDSKSDKKKSSGHKNETKVTKSSSSNKSDKKDSSRDSQSSNSKSDKKDSSRDSQSSSSKSDRKDSSRDSHSSNSSNNSTSSKKGKLRKRDSGEDSKGNTDSEDNRQRHQAHPASTGRSISVNDRLGYGAVTGLDIPPLKLYSTQLDPGVYPRNEHLLNRQLSAPPAAYSQFNNASHKGHNSSSQGSSGGTTTSSYSSHKASQFSSSLSSNCLSVQDRITGPNIGSNGFHSSHSASQLLSDGQHHQHYQCNSSSSNLNGPDELTSSGHVTGDLASPSSTTASPPSHFAYNNRNIPEENSPCLSPVSVNAPTTWEDALDSDSNLVRYGDEADGILSPSVAEDLRSSGNLVEDVSVGSSGGIDDGGCEAQAMTQGGEQHSFSRHNSSTRSTSSSSNNPNGDRHSTGHQIQRSDSSASPNNALPINSHAVSSEVGTGESHVIANESGVTSGATSTSFHSVNLSSSTTTQEAIREHRGATPASSSGGGGSLVATDYHSAALYGVDDNSWDFSTGGGNESFSSGGASVAVVSPLPSVLNIPGQDDHHSSRLCTNRTPSPRAPAPASGGESGGDETPHVTGGQSLDGLSRSSESTRSLSSVNHSKEKSQLHASSGADKDKKTKKAWYNVLNPTYKSRSEDLKRLFKDLPNDERLIVDYSCALQKDILVHGRLYVTSNYFCFYSKIFGWETLLSIQCKDIISMTKEKTALVIPNAIQITTDGEKNFFTTFAARDKTFLMLFRIWQNALMDQQMLASELWQWVHSCYGDELGLTSDDDDYIAPSTTEDDQRNNNNSNGHDKSISHLHMSSHSSSSSSSGGRLLHHAVVSASTPLMGAATAPPSVLAMGGDSGGEARNDVSQSDNAESTNSGTLTRGVPAPEHSDHHTSSSSSSGVGGLAPPPCQSTPEAAPPLPATPGRPAPKHSPSKSSRLSSKHSSPAKSVTGGGPGLEDSDTPDSEDLSSKQSASGPSLEAVVCPNQHTHHTGREIINKIYAIPIDALFTLLFTNSKMMLDVHAARKTTDVLASPWQSKEDTHQRLRQVTYTVALPTNSFGPKVSHVTETQVMSELTVPGEYYSIDAEASNAGIPYADSFLVSNHWCLTRESGSETRLVVWTSVKYKKSMWGFMKGVIDKNACSGVECLLTDIDTALQREVAQQSDLRQRTRRRRRRPTTKMADTEPGAGASAAATPGGAGQQTGAAALLGKENKPVKEPKQAMVNTVTRILGAPVNPLSSHRHAPLTLGGAALQSARSIKPSFAADEESSFFSGGIKLVAGALLLLLLTNMLLYWRLWQLEAIVRGQPTLGGVRGLLDIDPALLGKGVGEAWLQVLQEQEAAHSRQVEGWREQVAEAASLLNQAEGVLRGLHSNIPEQHAVSVRALLARLRSLDQQHTIAHEDQSLHLQHSGDSPHYLQHQDGGGNAGEVGVHHPPLAGDGMGDRGAALSDQGSHFDHHDHLDDDDNHLRQASDNVANAAS